MFTSEVIHYSPERVPITTQESEARELLEASSRLIRRTYSLISKTLFQRYIYSLREPT